MFSRESENLGRAPGQLYTLDMVSLSSHSPIIVCTKSFGAGDGISIRRARPLTNRVTEDNCIRDFAQVSVPRTAIWPSWHAHEFHEILLVRNGQTTHWDKNGERLLRRGDFAFIPPRASHSLRYDYDVTYSDVYLLPQWLMADLKLLWHEKGLVRHLLSHTLFEPEHAGVLVLRLTDKEVERCETEIEDMNQEYRERKHPNLAMLMGCFMKMLSIMNQAYLRDHVSADLSICGRIWKAVQLIEEAIEAGEELSLEKLAREAAMSRRNFTRGFRRVTGRSAAQYYRLRRFRLAQSLLMDTDRSVSEIALDLGFYGPAHFTKQFKEFAGVTPSDYRVRQAHLLENSSP